MNRPRLRTFTLWTGTLLSLLIVAAFVVSGWWFVAIQVPTKSSGPAVYLCDGSIALVMVDGRYGWLFVEPKSSWGLLFCQAWKWDHLHVELPLYALFAAVAIRLSRGRSDEQGRKNSN